MSRNYSSFQDEVIFAAFMTIAWIVLLSFLLSPTRLGEPYHKKGVTAIDQFADDIADGGYVFEE